MELVREHTLYQTLWVCMLEIRGDITGVWTIKKKALNIIVPCDFLVTQLDW